MNKFTVCMALVVAMSLILLATNGCGVNKELHGQIVASLADKTADLDATKAELAAVRADLDETNNSLDEKTAELDDAEEALDEAMAELKIVGEELESKNAELTAVLKELDEANLELFSTKDALAGEKKQWAEARPLAEILLMLCKNIHTWRADDMGRIDRQEAARQAKEQWSRIKAALEIIDNDALSENIEEGWFAEKGAAKDRYWFRTEEILIELAESILGASASVKGVKLNYD